MTCLSCSGTVPTNANFFLGSIPEPKGRLVRGRKSDFTNQGEEARRRASAVPGEHPALRTLGSEVGDAPGEELQPGATAAGRPLPRSPLSSPRPVPATAGDPPPPLREWTLDGKITAPPARTSHWVPTWSPYRGGGGAGRPRGGLQDWRGGRGQRSRCPSQATPPGPPRP